MVVAAETVNDVRQNQVDDAIGGAQGLGRAADPEGIANVLVGAEDLAHPGRLGRERIPRCDRRVVRQYDELEVFYDSQTVVRVLYELHLRDRRWLAISFMTAKAKLAASFLTRKLLPSLTHTISYEFSS